jgi:hypothetical protein
MMKKRERPLLWGQSDLEHPWFQQQLLEQALEIARQQELQSKLRGRRTVPKQRQPVETDPELDTWFE